MAKTAPAFLPKSMKVLSVREVKKPKKDIKKTNKWDIKNFVKKTRKPRKARKPRKVKEPCKKERVLVTVKTHQRHVYKCVNRQAKQPPKQPKVSASPLTRPLKEKLPSLVARKFAAPRHEWMNY